MFCDTQKIASSYETDNKLTIYLLEFCCTQPFIFPCLRLLLAVSFGDTEPYASGSATLFSEDQFDGSTAHCIRYADPQHTMALRTVLWLQKHRLVEVGKGPLEVTRSNPLLRQGHLEPAAQDRETGNRHQAQALPVLAPWGSSRKTEACVLGAELRLQTVFREATTVSPDDSGFQSPTKVELDSHQHRENWSSS